MEEDKVEVAVGECLEDLTLANGKKKKKKKNKKKNKQSSFNFTFEQYKGEEQLDIVKELVENNLSEPYSVFTYRYFLNQWPKFCFLAKTEDKYFGVIVCKLDIHSGNFIRTTRGYIAMVAVSPSHQGKGIGTALVLHAVEALKRSNCDEVVLETEYDNWSALKMYERIGFVRDKLLERYYLNGNSAYRLKLWFPPTDTETHTDSLKNDE
eukprot:GCRY01002794.1.p1 GENE.GCRY01002794.1~~GCRY01002794.1.p1  ORF type:complete len:209 (+),score=15.62 GCRY01002794.1:164-790(+)